MPGCRTTIWSYMILDWYVNLIHNLWLSFFQQKIWWWRGLSISMDFLRIGCGTQGQKIESMLYKKIDNFEIHGWNSFSSCSRDKGHHQVQQTLKEVKKMVNRSSNTSLGLIKSINVYEINLKIVASRIWFRQSLELCKTISPFKWLYRLYTFCLDYQIKM